MARLYDERLVRVPACRSKLGVKFIKINGVRNELASDESDESPVRVGLLDAIFHLAKRGFIQLAFFAAHVTLRGSDRNESLVRLYAKFSAVVPFIGGQAQKGREPL